MSLSRIHVRLGNGPNQIDLSAKQAGQIIVLFALMLTVLIGLVGIAIDVTYAWRNGLQVQRAADAAAMAGVVYLPGDLASATSRADAVATSNGYTDGGGTSVTVAPNPSDDKQLDVTITAPVQTFFVRLFGINTWTITRSARAAYVMPVPLGSPLAYYGVGCFVLKAGQQTNVPGCSTTGSGQSGVTATGSAFTGSNSLASLGGWGAIITMGGNQQNGDAYAPANNGGSPFSGANALYDPDGYYYTVSLPAGGSIKIFDPGFCAMGVNPSGSGNYGAGDHWIGSGGGSYPVSTYYTLWNVNNQPLNPNAWTTTGNSSGTLFESQKGWDTNNHSSSENSSKPSGTTACDANHDAWWTLASGLGAGTYEVEVATTNPNNSSINATTSAENMFAIEAVGSGSPAVYGQDRMCVYNNLWSGIQQFYLAKVDQPTGSGKTLEIDLFDPGDVGDGNATLQILGPSGSGGTQQLVRFNYTTDSNCGLTGSSDACSDTNVSQITTALNGSSSFGNTWIYIDVPLGTSYGSGGLWQGGWWQIQYTVGSENDTTTWSANVVGNPVHLVPMPVATPAAT